METGHSFNWNTVKIIDQEHNYFKRVTSEMINIKLRNNSINVMQNMALLDESYFLYLDQIRTQDISEREPRIV